ncbi:hypothetical protein SAMN05421504_102244 [Amycolatopsis xylanica]|uniref:Uncharacterized protein n=1 Tax=Amycolatopsis xylanica TaxID=589385 RepID=A0A1H2YS93_9PSEU|nr:hypothetical protein [Amycolatopsis xylanica]SDX08020.1 hypothetical protein SAMN05421504_102244 [Amycolatopsis xylanica]
MASKEALTALEGIGALGVIQGAGSMIARFGWDKDWGLLGLLDKHVFPTPWWVGLILAVAGLALILRVDQLKKAA